MMVYLRIFAVSFAAVFIAAVAFGTTRAALEIYGLPTIEQTDAGQ